MTNLRECRLKKGWPMIRLASAASVSYSNLSRYEQGWTTPSRQTAERLAHALDTDVTELFPDTSLADLGGVA